MSKATIWVRYEAPGWHNWPGAPDHRAYLRYEHRHLFHVEARREVAHDDRALEFHDVRDVLELAWGGMTGANQALGARSCEMMARELINALVGRFGDGPPWTVSVSEDGECGAVVTA